MTELILEAEQLLKTGCYQLAKDSFIAVLNREPENVKALYGLGLAYIPLQQFEKAYSYLQKAHQQDKTNPILLHDIANVARKLKKINDAKVFYSQAIELSPRYAEAYAGLATIYEMSGDLIKAEETYNRALSLDKDMPEVLYNLGKLMLSQGDLKRAEELLVHLLRQYPDNVMARFYMGLIAYEKEEWARARDFFLEVLQYRPYDIESLNNLGVISLKLDNTQQAIHYFGQVLAYEPTHRDARENIAATFMQNNRFDNAIIHYEEMLSMYPDYKQGQFNLACAYMTIGEFDKAKAHYRALLDVYEKHTDVVANLGMIAHQEGDHEEAEKYYKAVLEVEPNNKVVQHMHDALKGDQYNSSPVEYVRHLFDHYAYYYDKHLHESLKYAVPEYFKKLCKEKSLHYELGLDLGCGTGLAGEQVKPFGRSLIGIDISQKMLDMAESKHIYDKLICEDIHTYLKNTEEQFDMLFAADVLNYVGDLEQFFKILSTNLSADSQFLFTFEDNTDKNFELKQTGRFVHGKDYMELLLRKNNLVCNHSEKLTLRTQGGEPVSGCVMLIGL